MAATAAVVRGHPTEITHLETIHWLLVVVVVVVVELAAVVRAAGVPAVGV